MSGIPFGAYMNQIRSNALRLHPEQLRDIARMFKDISTYAPKGSKEAGEAFMDWKIAENSIKYQKTVIKPMLKSWKNVSKMVKGSALSPALNIPMAGATGFDLGNQGMNYAAENMGIPQTVGILENQSQDLMNMQRRRALLQGGR